MKYSAFCFLQSAQVMCNVKGVVGGRVRAGRFGLTTRIGLKLVVIVLF